MATTDYTLTLDEAQVFGLTEEQDVEQFVAEFEENDELSVQFGDVITNTTADFNELYNRPSYNGQEMTSETNIPEVVQYEAGEGITIENGVISAVPISVDSELSDTSSNPVENRVISGALASKADSDELATVAFSGEYGDLENEPTDFTQEEWSQLWTTY